MHLQAIVLIPGPAIDRTDANHRDGTRVGPDRGIRIDCHPGVRDATDAPPRIDHNRPAACRLDEATVRLKAVKIPRSSRCLLIGIQRDVAVLRLDAPSGSREHREVPCCRQRNRS